MGGFEEHGGMSGDWMGPGSVLSGMVGERGRSRSRSGLVERMAARAGYNAPPLRLNTDMSISPAPSPTSFLDSPVFLSNSLVQPSPTTGKFPFAPNANADGRSSSMMFSDSDKNEDNLFNNSSFAFKPVPESTPDHVNPFPSLDASSGQSENGTSLHLNSNLSTEKKAEMNNLSGGGNGSVEAHDEDNDNRGACEDGYNWRKYGQKQVKGSEHPRSYYKCTHPNCPVKKKVERSHEGHITEIIYKGAHNHPKPPPSRRSGMGEDNVELLHGTQFESVDASSTFSNDEDDEEDDRATHGSVSLGYDGEGDESESKRRKVEAYAAAADVSGGSRAIREPRVVVQTTSEVDILDDGYRWRKYGQKVVKGNPNPRSYYKCTSTGCTVRKHVERASHDLKSVITTYEGKHNHDVPAARNTSHANSQIQVHNTNTNTNTMGPRFDYQHQQHGYGYGYVGQLGFGPGDQGKFHQFLGQMGMMLPKGEPNVALNLPNANTNTNTNNSLYHNQMINRLPHM